MKLKVMQMNTTKRIISLDSKLLWKISIFAKVTRAKNRERIMIAAISIQKHMGDNENRFSCR